MQKVEKRSHPRRSFTKPVKYEVSVPEHRVEVIEAEILDISNDGACIVTERANEPGSFIRLRVSPHPRLAKVRWVDSTDGRFKMGLQFLM